MRGVIFELDELWEPEELASSAWFDPELWQHVRYLLQDEKWDQVASQTAIFVESNFRRWTALPTSTFGKDLMAAALRRGAGAFPLGRTAGEQEGWLALGIGFTAALGNADRHRIQQRDDARRHAVGVLGVGSLLLTQLRYEHGNRFMDEPEPAAGGDEQPGL